MARFAESMIITSTALAATAILNFFCNFYSSKYVVSKSYFRKSMKKGGKIVPNVK
jgi:hypothetical protein